MVEYLFSAALHCCTETCISLKFRVICPHGPKRVKYLSSFYCSTAVCRNMYLTRIPSNLSQKWDCGTKRDKYRFSNALYRNMYLTLIPSNSSPTRDCGPKRVKYRVSALYRNVYLTLIPSDLSPKRDCVLNGLHTDLVVHCTKTYIPL